MTERGRTQNISEQDRSRSRSREQEPDFVKILKNRSATHEDNVQAQANLIIYLTEEYRKTEAGVTINDFVVDKLDEFDITTNINIPTLIKNVENTFVDKTKLERIKEIARRKPHTEPEFPEITYNKLFKYISDNFTAPVNKLPKPFQSIETSMLNPTTFATSLSLEEKEEVADCINMVQPFPARYLHPDIIQQLNEYGPVDIELIDPTFTSGFSVRDEIVDAVERYIRIGASVDSQPGSQDSQDSAELPTTVAEIPIIFFVVCGHNFHVIYYLLYRNICYTIGYGYQGEDDKSTKQNELASRMGVADLVHAGNGAIYSPDVVFTSALKNKIIDAWVLDEETINKFNIYLNAGQQIFGLCKYVDGTRDVIIEKCIIDSPTWKYHTLPGIIGSKASFNCTTWAGEIQRGKVITDTLGISAPGFCRSKKGNSEKKAYEIVKYYIENNVQGLLRLLNPLGGGRLKTRKYRKHYKRKTRKHYKRKTRKHCKRKTRKHYKRKTRKHYKRKY